MRCLSCDVELNDSESSRKFTDSDEYIDLCNSCFNSAGFPEEDNGLVANDDISPFNLIIEESNEEDDTSL